jgi:hypothetical protein
VKRDAVRVAVGIKLRTVRKIIVFTFLVWSSMAWGATYYVSSSTGNDANNGTSSSTAWQTIARVNGQSFLPGDSVLFKRGDVWNESLTPASSGSSGNPIAFDAYGSGAAPNLTGYYAVPAAAWVLVTGNAWKAPLPATYTTVNFCLFGSIWGQKVAAVSSNLTAKWNFYLANGYVYVYSVGNPSIYYNEAIVPMALSNVPVININGPSWLTFQHFLVNWFDQYGVYVQGSSDHLVFANMEADSMIPQGTQPLGFYVDESAPGPGDIKIYNAEAHLNYDGFRFDGSATAITMVNDKGYANRDGALVDNTGAVTYSYCHFYASSLAVAGSTDVEWTSGSGPTAGAGNIAADTAPAVQVYQRYPANITLTVDDSGMTAGADTYYADTVLPVADAAGIPVGAAITVGYPLAQTLISEFQGWVNAGRDVTAHSISHTYYVNSDALDIQYIGSGTAAALTVSGNTLTIAVTGASDGVTYNLARGQPQGTMLGLAQALAATGKYTYSFLTPCQGPYGTGCAAYTAAALLSQDLADVTGQDVKTSVYHMQLNVTQLTTDEITLSRQWMTTNLTGLPATPVYVYPGGYETTSMQGITEGVPYTGARGALKEDLGVKDTYADGFNVQNITSFGVNPSWMGVTGVTPAMLNQKIQALVWKESVWGVPWGVFWHLNELVQDDPVGGTEITNLIQDFKNSGATVLTNTGLVNWLLSGTQETGTDGNYYYALPATSMTLDFRPTKNSPVVDAGENLGTAYELDINGVNQNSYGTGWEIGAHVYEGYAVYGDGTGAGSFTIGTGANPALAWATLPQVWVNNDEGVALFSYELSLPSTWVTGAAPGCTFHTPYWTGSPTSTGLQSAINDIESCRTGIGAGIKLDIPPGLYTSASGIVIPQTSNSPASSFLILDSTEDSSLPNGQIVCAHGMQDNLATSTDIGLDNPDCAGDALTYQLGTTVGQLGQTIFSLDDIATGWQLCAYIDPVFCAGGTGIPTATSQTFGNASPALDGYSMNLSLSGPAYTNAGWSYDYAVNDSANAMALDWWFYPTNTADIQAMENDQFKYLLAGNGGVTQNTRMYFGTQCVLGSVFDVWNSYGGGNWVSTGVNCPTITANAWHHEVIKVHYNPGDTSAAGGYPKMYYDSITLDGTTYVSNFSSGTGGGALPETWSEASGAMFQMDTNSTCGGGCTVTQSIDEAKGSQYQSNFNLANGNSETAAAYNDVQFMWTAECSGTNCVAIQTCSPLGASSSSNPPACTSTAIAPDHWLIEDGEFRMSVGNTGNNSIAGSIATGTETSSTQFATHMHWRKDWSHGDWTSLTAGANSITSGFAMSACNYCSVVDSQVSQALRPGAEGHAISTEGIQYKFDHNWLEGQSSGVFAGGYSAVAGPSISGWIPLQDVEMRRNRLTFPYAWLGAMTIPSGNAHWAGQSLVRKNAEEFKEGQRVLQDGNIFENVDNSGGQNGTIITRNVRATSSTSHGQNYQAVISDITETNNIYRNACQGWEIDARSSAIIGDGGGVAYPMKRYALANDLEYNITNTNPGCTGVSAFGDQMSSAGQSWQGTITGNGTTATFVATCSVDGGDCPSGPPSQGFQVMDVSAGDPLWISGCTSVTGFNAPTHVISGHTLPIGVGPLATAGSAAWSGTFNTAGVTVSWASTVTGTDSSANCTVSNIQGGPQFVSVTHHTLITDANQTVGNGNTLTSGPNFQIDHLFRDSILLSSGASGAGWYNSVVGEGTPTEQFNYDYTSISADHLVWPTRTASKYTEYGNNASYPDSAVCTGAGCNPPSTMYFPATPYCTGASSTSACVGFIGAMSASSMPLTLPDYHNYELRSDSSFYAGNTDQASDGTSVGTNIPAIDAAQTQNLYVCATACGSGPYPDSLGAGAAASFWGFSESDTNGGGWPTVNYGMQRFWDSPPLQWPYLNTASGVFNFTSLDSDLALAYSNGAMEGMYTLARTPTWASSDPTDATCNYTGSGAGLGDGECDAPSDLNSDGSGADAIWKAWITAIATHVNSPGYTDTHSHIKYWEIWNEPDTQAFWNGSIAALARLTEDANCIITGRGVIHENGNGTSTPCTATAIDPTAQIVMASAHAKGPALTYGQNELYCNNTSGIPAYELPCPNPANTIATAVDILNFHMKPGSESGNNCPAPILCTAESAMQWYIANIQSILQPAELAKPLWDGEAQYSPTGFANAYTDPDMAASFMPRFYLMDWSLGVSGIAWYYASSQAEPASAETSYQQTYNWLENSSLITPCAASGTLWSCTIVNAGTSYLIMWDTSQSCSDGVCTTGNQTVGSQWTQYQDMTTASTPITISGHSVPVGIKAVVIQ